MSKNQNTMSKEAFIQIIQAIIDMEDQLDRMASDVGRYWQHATFELGGEELGRIAESVEACFAFGDPKHSWITWWLWGSPDRGRQPEFAYVRKRGIEYSLETPALLYEYLTTGKTSVLI